MKLLEIPGPIIEQAVEEELAGENLVAESIEEKPALFLTALYRAERGIAEHLARLVGEPCWGSIDTDRAVPWVEEKTGLSLSESQREAVGGAVNGKVTVITGGPGVGKTTVVDSILQIIRAKGVKVLLCAPTGAGRQTVIGIHECRSQDHPPPAGVRSPNDGLQVQPGRAAGRRADRGRRSLDGRYGADEPAVAGGAGSLHGTAGRRHGSAAFGRPRCRIGGHDRLRCGAHRAARRDLSPGGLIEDHRQRPPYQPRPDAGAVGSCGSTRKRD